MPQKPLALEGFKLLEIFLIFVVIPTIVFYLLADLSPNILKYIYYFIVSLFVFQSALSYIYTTSAIGQKKFKELSTAEHKPAPKTTFIVSAYLPNEIQVIEETLINILKKIERSAEGIEVILAYNTPYMESIESRLKELAYQWSELILANAYDSKSKSENLNYALEIASGDMIVLIDADHLLEPSCIRRAWRWLDEGYSIVQGRCKIRNGNASLISGLVEVEFETIYGISHFAKSKLFNSALFGGTNGYWKSSVIKEIGFRKDRLTEDIDSTLRAILSGKHIVHDRSIVSTELAPETLSGLWFQRKRWAQGWFQCSLSYQKAIFKTKYLNVLQKFMWTTMLMWRIIYDILGHYLFPVVFAYWLHQEKISFPMNAYIWFALIFTLCSGPYEAIAAFKNAAPPRTSILHYIIYALLAFPYTLFKNTIQVVAIRDELQGRRDWIVTQRAN